MSDNETVVREFIDTWSGLDPDELAGYFTRDAVYHNVPIDPVEGRDEIRDFIADFAAEWTATKWEVRTILSQGDVVIAERIDHIEAGDRSVDLPVVGIFELRDGKIRLWRDYFDMGTYLEALG